MSVAVESPPPPQTAEGDAGIDRLLEAAGGGSCLLLAAREFRGVLSAGALAAHSLLLAIKASKTGGAKPVVLVAGGGPPAGTGRAQRDESPAIPLNTFGEHEGGWVAAGDLYEKIAADPSRAGYTHVFCLDPWAATMESSLRRMLNGARWVLISDPLGRREGGDAEYWNQCGEWFRARNFDHILPVGTILPLLPEDFWISGDVADLRDRLQNGHSGARIIVVDESPAAPPAPHLLCAAREWWGPDCRVVLLSPHVDRYREMASGPLQDCAMALNREDLSVSVYASLLRCADIYVAPGRLPFGPGPLVALTDIAEIYAGPEAENEIPEALRGHTKILPSTAAEVGVPDIASVGTAATSIPAPPDSPARAAPASGERTDDVTDSTTREAGASLHGWWRQLGGLIRQEGEREDGRKAAFDIAILTCCYKFLQRFRVFLDSIARQDHPADRIEVCVSLPGNPDGAREYIDLFRKSHPRLAISVADMADEHRANRGKMINAAFRASSAPVVMAADGDLVLPPGFVRTVLASHKPERVSGCWRIPVNDEVTAHIVTGNLDPVALFDELRKRWTPADVPDVRQGVLGYCQVVSRDAFAKVGYPEEFNSINQSDIVFVDRLREHLGIQPDMMKDLFVLHLDHPRDWGGTKMFL